MLNPKEITSEAFISSIEIDAVSWKILAALQANARSSFAELGRQVGLTAPAVADRVRRLEEAGVITGYRTEVNATRLGLGLSAFVRFSVTNGAYPQIDRLLRTYPEIMECHRVTGSDCYIMRVAVASVAHLENLINRLTPYGTLTTSLILSSPITQRTITPASLAWGDEGGSGK
jgi:Lrp/AsnC family leucine-responsive transcriptional regulator